MTLSWHMLHLLFRFEAEFLISLPTISVNCVFAIKECTLLPQGLLWWDKPLTMEWWMVDLHGTCYRQDRL